MNRPPEPPVRPLDLSGKKAAAPAKPDKQAQHVRGSVWEKPDGMFETRGHVPGSGK